MAASAFFVAVHPTETRADLWSWLSALVADPESDEPETVSRSGSAIPPDAIVTAPGETRRIELGHDLLELHPSTAVTFEVSGQRTTVHLFAGTIRATVAKRKKSQSFEVWTPILVGIVKGTVFEVSMGAGTSAISVYEGRVALKALNAVGGIDVTPGNTGTVSAQDHQARLGKTPDGGAAAAAKSAAKAAGLVREFPSRGGGPSASSDQARHPADTPSPAGKDDKSDKEGKPEQDGTNDGDKHDDKHDQGHRHGHQHGGDEGED